MDWLYTHDLTKLFAGIATQARRIFGIKAEQVHVDTTSFSVTQIFFPEPGQTGTLLVVAATPTLLRMISAAWQQHRRVTVAGAIIRADKLAGLQPGQPYELLMQSGAGAAIVEADGARHRMIKAPAEHEPVIPTHTNIAFVMMSAAAIDQPLSAEVAHRPERVASVVDMSLGETLTPVPIARLMNSGRGAMKNVPAWYA